MECTQTQIDSKGNIFCLFLEEDPSGAASSKITKVSSFGQSQETLFEIDDWISSIWVSPEDRLFFIDFEGNISFLDNGPHADGQVDILGTIFLRGFSQSPDFVLGEDGYMCFRGGSGWRQISIGGEESLYSVTFSKDRYYICGEGGLILEFDGSTLNRIQTPTNVDLHGVELTDSLGIVAVGDLGIVVTYRDEEVDSLSIDVESLQDVAEFNGQILVTAGEEGVWKLSGADEKVELIYDGVCYMISKNQTHLVTHGGGFLHVFDGSSWATIAIEGQ